MTILLLVGVGCSSQEGAGTADPEDPESSAKAAAPTTTGTHVPAETSAVETIAGEWRHLAIGEATGADRPVTPREPTNAELQTLRGAVEADPSDAERRRRLAIALHQANRREEALEEFRRVAETNRGVRNLLDLALAFGSLSRLDEAEQTYDEILRSDPAHAVALHNLGNIALKRDRNERAVELYRRAIAARPDYLLAHFHLGDALKQAGMYREAYTTYARVVELEPVELAELEAFENALYNMASLDITMGAHERAAQMLRELIGVNPQHHAAHYAYGQVMLQLGRPQDAQRAFETHMQLLSQRPRTGTAAMGE